MTRLTRKEYKVLVLIGMSVQTNEGYSLAKLYHFILNILY